MISIFTPFYKTETKYLFEAFLSLKSQTYKKWEWVILLNGTGLQADLAFLESDYRVKIFKTDKTGIIGELKHICAGYCQYPFICELDYDDILTPDCLQEVHDAFLDDNIQMVYSNCAEFESGTWKPNTYSGYWGWKMRPFAYQGKELIEMLSWPPNAQMMRRIEWAPNHIRCWRKSSYDEIGGHDVTLKVADDHDLCCRYYLKYGEKGIKLIDKCLYLYRVHPTNNVKLLNGEIQAQTDKNYNKYCRQMAERWAKDNDLAIVDFLHIYKSEMFYKEDSVGVIYARYCIEHLDNPIDFMNEAYRVLAPGGWLFIDVPSTDGRGAYQHPLHKSFWNQNSFWYYTNESLAKSVPEFKGKFQVSKLITWHASDFEKEHDIKTTQADLICVKPPYHENQVGEVLWQKEVVFTETDNKHL